jgi:hypothetical protein
MLLLIPGVLGQASTLFPWNGCHISDTECQCGMPGTSPGGNPTTVHMDEAFCDTMIAAGNATAWKGDGTCKGKCTEGGSGCYGSNGYAKGHGQCACHINEAKCDELLLDGKAMMFSYSSMCSGDSCTPYTPGCMRADGSCQCTAPIGEISARTGRAGILAMTEEYCAEMVANGTAEKWSLECGGSGFLDHGKCDEHWGCYGTNGVTKGHGQCACMIDEAMCMTMKADGRAASHASWSMQCNGLCQDLPSDTTAPPPVVLTDGENLTNSTDDAMDSGASIVLFGALSLIFS